jgi:hypothetical protein
MPKLAVDPQALSGAGAAVIAGGDAVAAAVSPLTAGFGANTGQDSSGEAFGLAYQDAGKSLLQAMASGINACRNAGYKVELGAFNYSRAEAGSTLGGGAATLPQPTEPGKFEAPGAPWTLGAGVPPPALWMVVQAFVGDLWPNGNPGQMHAAAGCWRAFGATLRGVKGLLNGPMSVVSAQQIPEAGAIHNTFSKLGDDTAKLGDQCDKIAKSLDDFADKVLQTQDAIRDLLHRLGSASGLWNEVTQVLTGHGLDEVKKIADDIKRILQYLGREAEAQAQLFREAVQEGDALVRALQIEVRAELVSFFGEDVGNPLATAFDIWTNVGEGLLNTLVAQPIELLQSLDPMRFLSDPQGALATWEGTAKGLGEMLLYGMPGGNQLVDALDPSFSTNMSKALLHLDDWSTARPGLGAGENAGDLLMLFVPGLGEAGAGGKVAEASGEAARAADAAGEAGRAGGALGKAGEVAGVGGAFGDVTKTTSALTKDLEGLGGEIPRTDPAPGSPVGLPPARPGEPPLGPTPPRVEPAPPRTEPPPPVTSRPPGDVPAAPPPGVPERAPVSAPNGHPPVAPAPAAAPNEYLPSTNPKLAGPAPAEAQLPAYGAPADAPPAAAPAPPSAPAFTAPAPQMPPADVPRFPADQLPPAAGDAGGSGGPTAHSPGTPHSLGPGADPAQPPHGAAPSRVGDEHGPFSTDDGGDHSPLGSSFVGPYQLPPTELVTPPPDGAFFWSGRTSEGIGIGPESAGGNGSADLFAASHGGTTLEGLLERNGVKAPLFDFTDAASQEWWSTVSGMYAENVQGEVYAVVGSNVRPGNVWETVELPRLIDNPNVTKIVVIDPETGLQKTICER